MEAPDNVDISTISIESNMKKFKEYVERYENLTVDTSYEYERHKIIELIADNITKNINDIWNVIKAEIGNIIKSNNIKKYSNNVYNHEILCHNELKKIKLNTLRDIYIIRDDRLKNLLNNSTSLDSLYKLFGTNRFNISIKFSEYQLPLIESFKTKIIVSFNANGFLDFINSTDKNSYYDNDDTLQMLENIRNTIVIAKNINTKETKFEQDIEHKKIPDDANFPLINKIGEMIVKLGINKKIKKKITVKYLINDHHEKFITKIKNIKDAYEADDSSDSEDTVFEYDNNVKCKKDITTIYTIPFEKMNITTLIFDLDDFILKNNRNIKKVNNYTDNKYYEFTDLENDYLNTIINFGSNSGTQYGIYIDNFYSNKISLKCEMIKNYDKFNNRDNHITKTILNDSNYTKTFNDTVRSYAKELAVEIPKTISDFIHSFRDLQIRRKKFFNMPDKTLPVSDYVSFYFNHTFLNYLSSKRSVYEYEHEYILETVLEELMNDDIITYEMNNEINNILNVKDFTFKYSCIEYILYGETLSNSLILEFTPPEYLLVKK